MADYYPKQLAEFVQDQWGVPKDQIKDQELNESSDEDTLPSLPLLEELLSTAYQASLWRDEGRPVSFRLILRAPDRFTSNEGPPTGLTFWQSSFLRTEVCISSKAGTEL
jgi:hypothetical protein